MTDKAKMMDGMASMILVSPMTRSSHHLPKNPAVSPRTIPIRLFSPWLIRPTESEIRAP
jgi:hypothetical protein